ncbi:hypothetical protein B0H10DRAFT_537534 [Mycena sp. CBHHK59/15]|nr:hypothetical protein B0H10DRAFT_537534 [Mycena sp. CBHHK59/15]
MLDLTAYRAELVTNHLYLGASSFRDEVVWRRIGWDNKLVTKESAVAVEGAAEAESSVTASDTDEDKDELSETGLTPATLAFVGLISPENFWLTPCRYWKGPTKFTKTFADLKLDCHMVVPKESVFAGDFPKVLENLRWLMAATETEGNQKKGILDEKPASSIKARHVVFEKLSGGEEAPDFKLGDWPVKSDAARKALAGMEKTHSVNVLLAYDANGGLIQPAQYRDALRGAVVRAAISLSHWNFAPNALEPSTATGVDTYTANIESLRVLIPPKAEGPSSPRKRRVPLRDPGASPMKKPRAA